MRLVAGVNDVDVLPNGVDGEFFRPGDRSGRAIAPRCSGAGWTSGRTSRRSSGSAAGSGRACGRAVPDARFTIIGFQPTDDVQKLARRRRASRCSANVRDLRATARRHAVAVLPFVSGAGIKNKLLEAAALGLPIVCTPIGVARLARHAAARHRVDSPRISRPRSSALWGDAATPRQLGAASRELGRAAPHVDGRGARRAIGALGGRAQRRRPDAPDGAVRVGFVLHSMHVAGAEVLVAETIRRLGDRASSPSSSASTSSARSAGACSARACRSSRSAAGPASTSRVSKRMATRDSRRGAWRCCTRTSTRRSSTARSPPGSPAAAARDLHRARAALPGRRLDAAPPGQPLVLDRLADHVNAVCEFSARSLSEVDGFSKGRIEVIPNGVDLPRYGRVTDIAAAAAAARAGPGAALHHDASRASIRSRTTARCSTHLPKSRRLAPRRRSAARRRRRAA